MAPDPRIEELHRHVEGLRDSLSQAVAELHRLIDGGMTLAYHRGLFDGAVAAAILILVVQSVFRRRT